MDYKESAEMKSNCVVAENKRISAFAHLLRGVYKISGAKRRSVCRRTKSQRSLKSRIAIVAYLYQPTARHIMKQYR